MNSERRWSRDGALLSLGTFTAIPVPAPQAVTRRSAEFSLVLAPLWGAAIAAFAALVAITGQSLFQRHSTGPSLAALFAGVLFVAVGAMSSRALHLDGLADTADGFASLRRGEAALTVMRDPRVGALGMVALLLVILLQVVAVAGIVQRTQGVDAVVVLAATGMLSRAPLPWLARAGSPAAHDGLGRTVVGAAGKPTAVLTGLIATGVAVVMLAGMSWATGLSAALVAWWVPLWLRYSAVRRFGVVTGDLLGAAIELSLLGVLLVVALV